MSGSIYTLHHYRLTCSWGLISYMGMLLSLIVALETSALEQTWCPCLRQTHPLDCRRTPVRQDHPMDVRDQRDPEQWTPYPDARMR